MIQTIPMETRCTHCEQEYGDHRDSDNRCPTLKADGTPKSGSWAAANTRFEGRTDKCDGCGELGSTCICFHCNQDICDGCFPKFNAIRAGYMKKKQLPVVAGRCDGCDAVHPRAHLLVHETVANLVR